MSAQLEPGWLHPGASESVSVEIRPLTSLGDVVEPWKRLVACALEPNVFLDPAFASAAARVFGTEAMAAVVWSCAKPEMLGLFPVRIEGRRYGLPLPVLCGWTHPFAPFGTPLVHRDAAELAIAAWLDHVTQDRTLPALLLIPYTNDDGPFAAALDAVLARRGNASARYDRHQRALLAPGERRADYLAHAVARKQRKELARQWRRMQELGPVTVSHAQEAGAVAAALEDFLRLEAAGWKGRAGTAAATDPAVRNFMSRAVANFAAEGGASIQRLCLGEQPIAACITLRHGRSAWCWKIAYDEAYARFSPGAQLLTRLTETLLQDTTIADVDSLATPNHPLIDHIWRERRTMSDRLISLRPDSLVPFSVICSLETIRRLGRSAARAIRDRVRRVG